MFEVVLGDDIRSYDTRREAIDFAKEWTQENRGTVSISDEDRRERLTYQGGELVSYDYETRRR
ncbi:MAG: hypothetical protein ACQEXJ_07315 [Myxococcota bacterium]